MVFRGKKIWTDAGRIINKGVTEIWIFFVKAGFPEGFWYK
jgi:hypothetical protein